jgi:hypothetical protein
VYITPLMLQVSFTHKEPSRANISRPSRRDMLYGTLPLYDAVPARQGPCFSHHSSTAGCRRAAERARSPRASASTASIAIVQIVTVERRSPVVMLVVPAAFFRATAHQDRRCASMSTHFRFGWRESKAIA